MSLNGRLNCAGDIRFLHRRRCQIVVQIGIVGGTDNGRGDLGLARGRLGLRSLGFCLSFSSSICLNMTFSWSIQMPWEVTSQSYSPISPISVSFPSFSHHAHMTFMMKWSSKLNAEYGKQKTWKCRPKGCLEESAQGHCRQTNATKKSVPQITLNYQSKACRSEMHTKRI